MNCHYNKIITIIIQDTGMSFLTGDFTGSCIELNNCICNLYKLSELTRHFVEQHHLKYISYRCRYIYSLVVIPCWIYNFSDTHMFMSLRSYEILNEGALSGPSDLIPILTVFKCSALPN